MVKVYLIGGEISGDFIGSHLMASLKNLYKISEQEASQEEISFVGAGGRMMEEAGLKKSLFPIKQISLMGFIEVIPHLFKIIKLINQTVIDILQQKPDLLITIDSPGFTYRVAKKVRILNPNLKILHIVAPSVWAYKPSRALKYAKVYNCLFALLPFEPPYFQNVGLDCRYIGHPIVEQNFYKEKDKSQLKQELQLSPTRKVLAITCGSRVQEIVNHMPIFVEAINLVVKQYPELVVMFAIVNLNHQDLIKTFLASATFEYSFSLHRLKLFAAADLALAKSGTNTLEIAACNTPMIVVYKLHLLSYWLIKWLIRIKYVSIINIVGGKPIIPELIQFNCTKDKIADSLISLLGNREKAAKQVQENRKILTELGFNSPNPPSSVAATIIKAEYLSKI